MDRTLAANEVRIEHRAIGVNRADLAARPGPPLGGEAVGVVAALGEQVRGVALGQRVGYFGVGTGAFASAANVPAWRLVPIPAAIDDVTAAAVLHKGLVAEMLVRRVFKVGPGHRVLVPAAVSGVGALLCPWLRAVGATVLGVVGSAAKRAFAERNGCQRVLVAGEDDVVAAVMAFTKDRGLDVVYDGLGAAFAPTAVGCLRQRGLWIQYGDVTGEPSPFAAPRATARSLFVTRPALADYTASRQELLHAASVLWEMVATKRLPVTIAAELPLGELAAALQRLRARTVIGSLVLRP
jgi:NADPH:quinone reductase